MFRVMGLAGNAHADFTPTVFDLEVWKDGVWHALLYSDWLYALHGIAKMQTE